MSEPALSAHSLAEAYFYLMVTPCPACGKGPLRGSDAQRVAPDSPVLAVRIDAACAACAARSEYRFQLPHGTRVDADSGIPDVNPGDRPSGIIDVGQWLTLFRAITTKASGAADKPEARRLGLEAAQCLEEALKFYEEGNDVPPAGAFFCDRSRQRFRDHPEQFSRQRLIDLRARLPRLSVMLAQAGDPRPAKRRWWKRP